jgi:hypothetical protein
MFLYICHLTCNKSTKKCNVGKLASSLCSIKLCHVLVHKDPFVKSHRSYNNYGEKHTCDIGLYFIMIMWNTVPDYTRADAKDVKHPVNTGYG